MNKTTASSSKTAIFKNYKYTLRARTGYSKPAIPAFQHLIPVKMAQPTNRLIKNCRKNPYRHLLRLESSEKRLIIVKNPSQPHDTGRGGDPTVAATSAAATRPLLNLTLKGNGRGEQTIRIPRTFVIADYNSTPSVLRLA